MRPGSWIVVSKKTGKAVLETFEEKTAKAINRANYRVLPALVYLVQFNRSVKEAQNP